MNEPVDQGALSNGLFYSHWASVTNTRGCVIIAHGLAEHCGRYAHVAAVLNAIGLEVYAVDHLGHGRSPGARLVVDEFDQYVDGLDTLYSLVVAEQPGRPVVMLGHSMGGLIAVLSAQRHPQRYHSLVLSGPAILPVDPPPQWQQGLVRFISRWLPAAGVVALDSDAISKAPEVVRQYRQDPLVYTGKVTARLAAGIFDAMARAREGAGRIHIPVLLMHGTQDRLTALEGSEYLAAHVGSADCELYRAEGAYHELFNEPEQDRYLSVMTDWLSARL